MRSVGSKGGERGSTLEVQDTEDGGSIGTGVGRSGKGNSDVVKS